MNIRKVVLGSVFVALAELLIVACASKPAATKADEPLYGTWVNEEYTTTIFKRIFSPEGKVLWYRIDNPNLPIRDSQFVIEDMWIDSEGNTWYKVREKGGIRGDNFTLIRISASEDTLELEYAKSEYPENFSSLTGDKYKHKVFYRQ